MRNFIITLCLIASTMLVVSSCTTNSTKPIKTTLKGEVIDRPETTHLILFKNFEEINRSGGIEIPIVDGKFEYVLLSKHIEKYYLAFKDEFEQGYMRTVQFFSEPGVINFTLFPMERYSDNQIKGGKLNKTFQKYWNIILEKSEKIDNDLLKYLNDNYGEIIEKQELPEEFAEHADDPFWQDVYGKVQLLEFAGIDVRPFIDSVRNEGWERIFQWQLQYIKENKTLVGYTVFVDRANSIIQMNRLIKEGHSSERVTDIAPYEELYRTVFARKFPNHPYTEQLEKLFAKPIIVVGAKFVDFSTPDLSGNRVTFSEQIVGKPSLLYLWASWCGPCLRKGKELIPVYEEFRDKGFVVIGVANEREVAHAESAIERHKFPWKNLIDLRGVEKIWEKYEVAGAGAEFLIDENGIIVAINPTAEEVRNFLINKFQ